MNDWNLAGRRVVITGAARGLGRALAIVAADHGARPVLLARNAAAAHEVAAVMFAVCAPRVCAYPTIVLENMSGT